MNTASPALLTVPPEPFPRVFVVANALELLERLAFYGVYINLSVYLVETVGLTDRENGDLLGLFAVGRSWIPVAIGALADRITFRRSLLTSFALYAIAYFLLWNASDRTTAYLAVAGMALGGAFLKPVITGCVRRYSPPGRQTQGFAIFYAMVNAGSVIGKIGAKWVRTALSLRTSILNSVVACAFAFLVTFAFFHEPEQKLSAGEKPRSSGGMKAFVEALQKWPLVVFLALVSGYYLLIEQFYQTFPAHIVRVVDATAPREYITLINPASIALLQVPMARLTSRLDPLLAMGLGIGIGGISMLAMGSIPTLWGCCGSFFLFAVAEMMFSPRYYDFVSSFAPKGNEGLYMGIALIPFGVGGLVGGVLSGRLIERYLPLQGEKQPLVVWGTYAAIGAVCAALLLGYRAWHQRRPAAAA